MCEAQRLEVMYYYHSNCKYRESFKCSVGVSSHAICIVNVMGARASLSGSGS